MRQTKDEEEKKHYFKIKNERIHCEHLNRFLIEQRSIMTELSLKVSS